MEPRTYPTPGDLTLELQVPAGTLDVRAADVTETRLEIEGEHDPEEIEVTIHPDPEGGQRLRVRYERGRRLIGRGELHVRAVVPEGSRVEAETGSADLIGKGRLGAVSFRSGSGDLQIEEASGDASAKTASGDVAIALVGGDLTANGASGDVLIGQILGGLTARTASGDVLVGAIGASATVITVAGDIKVGSLSTGAAALRSVSGDIEVGVARGTSVYLDLSSASGDVITELDDLASPAGDADLDLAATTVSGDIAIRRATSVAAAP